MSTTTEKSYTPTTRESFLPLPDVLVILSKESTNYKKCHICKIELSLQGDNKFMITSLHSNERVQLTQKEGILFLARGTHKNLTILKKEDFDMLTTTLTGRTVVFGDTDHTALLNFNSKTFHFTAQLGSNIQNISIPEAKILLTTGALPNLQLL